MYFVMTGYEIRTGWC